MVRYEVREGPADPAEAEQERWQRHRARREFLRGRTADAARIWVAQPGSPRHPIDFLLLSAALAQAGDARAAELAAQLPSLVDREQVLATLASARGDREAALAHLLACWRAMRTEPFFDERTFAASMLVARSLLKHDVGRASTIFDALAEPFAAHRFEANRLQERLRLSVMLPPERQDCLQVFGALEPYPPWNAEMLTLRHRCYQTQGHPLADQAADDLADVLAGAVATFDDLELPTAGGP